MFSSQLLISAALFNAALAQSDSNNDSPTMVGWVSPVARRSTWDIIWSCLSIFIVCSWKCVHLNIPSHRESCGEWVQVLGVPCYPSGPLVRKWSRRLLWMMFIAVAPEVGVGLAVRQYMQARDMLRGHEGFTMAHAFYVQMGGIVLYDPSSGDGKLGDDGMEMADNPPPYPAMEQGILLGDSARANLDDELSCRIIDDIDSLDDPRVFPKITPDDIKDRSKADGFTKIFALLQSSWLIVQSIARRYQGLAISQLELATMAFILCALCMHAFWWHKPFGLERRQVLVRIPREHANDPRGPRPIPAVSVDDLMTTRALRRYRASDLDIGEFIDLLVDFLAVTEERKENMLPSVALYLTGIGFSAIHLVAWNWEFPSPVVQTLWRVFALVAFITSFFPIIALPTEVISKKLLAGRTIRGMDGTLLILSGLGFIAYIVARLSILVLTIYTLTSMPASAYETVKWTAWIPHFA